MKKRNLMRMITVCACLIFLAITPVMVRVQSQAKRPSQTQKQSKRALEYPNTLRTDAGTNYTKLQGMLDTLSKDGSLIGDFAIEPDGTTKELIIGISNAADFLIVSDAVSKCNGTKLMSVVPPPTRDPDQGRPPSVLARSKKDLSNEQQKDIRSRLYGLLSPNFTIDRSGAKLEIRAVIPQAPPIISQRDFDKAFKRMIADLATLVSHNEFTPQ